MRNNIFSDDDCETISVRIKIAILQLLFPRGNADEGYYIVEDYNISACVFNLMTDTWEDKITGERGKGIVDLCVYKRGSTEEAVMLSLKDIFYLLTHTHDPVPFLP